MPCISLMRLTDRILRFFHNYWLIIAITALVKVAIAGTVIFLQPLPSGFFESFSHWDSYRYISIAKNWYAIENGREIVWFPFYPFLIRLVSYATSDYFLSGVLISVFFHLRLRFFSLS
jgi:hypothetical protein